MPLVYSLIAAAVLLLGAGILSLVLGKTIGLYGVVETRTSIFYWTIVATYLGLGGLALYNAVRLILR